MARVKSYLPFGVLTPNRGKSVQATSGLLMNANYNRMWATMYNWGVADVFINYSKPALVNFGFVLPANGGFFQIDKNLPWLGEVYAVAASGTCAVSILEVEQEVK